MDKEFKAKVLEGLEAVVSELRGTARKLDTVIELVEGQKAVPDAALTPEQERAIRLAERIQAAMVEPEPDAVPVNDHGDPMYPTVELAQALADEVAEEENAKASPNVARMHSAKLHADEVRMGHYQPKS